MRKILVILVLGSILFSGCLFKPYSYVYDRYPVYDLPIKTHIPKISLQELNALDTEIRKTVVDTVISLKIENAQLRAILDSYNDYAKSKNLNYNNNFNKTKRSWRLRRGSGSEVR